MDKKRIFIVSVLIFLCCPIFTFSETINLESGKTIENNYCGADNRHYDTPISNCFRKTVVLIGILSLQEKNGQKTYFLEKPQWGDRSRLSFPAKHNRFYVSPDEFGPDVPKIFIEFKKGVDIQKFFKKQVRLVGKVDNKESTPFKCTGVPGEQIIWSEKYPNGDYCIIKDEPRRIIIEVEQIERYIPPETWAWVDNNLPNLKSKEVIKENVIKTAKFFPAVIFSNHDCLFLDSPKAKDQFKKIVIEGTENCTWKEYLDSTIEMTARGALEKRVYDFGECCHCPPGAKCGCGPCGEHTWECINAEEIWGENNAAPK